MGLAEVLTAILRIAMMIEPCEQEILAHYGQGVRAAEFVAEHPEAFAAIDDAEEILCEPSHILDLLDEIWTGRLRTEPPYW